MRKSVIAPETSSAVDLDQLARVEVSSEDAAFPIENAFAHSSPGGWRADTPGKQTIRLLFDEPITLNRTTLEFHEPSHTRTQQFTLTAQTAGGETRELVRQQWNFSPSGSTDEVENVPLTIGALQSLTLEITPDISGGIARASVKRWLVFR